MPCLSDDTLASLATGHLGRLARRRALRQISGCGECRGRYDTLAPALRSTLHTVSERRGHLHPDPGALRRRIFAAIEEDRSRRASRGKRRVLRLVPAVAAAAVLLVAVFLGIRLLSKEDPRVGKVYRDAGAVLVARGSEPPVLQRRDSRPILPGDIILVAPGGRGSFSLSELGHAEFSDSLLVVVGDPDSGPALHVVRGTLLLYNQKGETLRVAGGARTARVDGRAEVEVLPEDPAACMALARNISARLTRSPSDGLMRSARAVEETASAPAPRVRVHAFCGQVSFGDGLPSITSGSQILFQADGNFLGPALVGAGSLPLQSADDLLTPEEQELVPDLLSREADAFASLLSAAGDDTLAPWQRGLAVWLLGELGAPSVIDGLSEMLDPEGGMPVEVRSAAVRTLSLFGEKDLVRLALDDRSPAVVEASIQAIALRFPSLAKEALPGLAGDRNRSAYHRALAAFALDGLGVETPLDDVLSLCHSDDPRAHRLADRLLAGSNDEDAGRELRKLLGSSGAERKTAIIQCMAAISVSGAETIAQHALHERDYPHLRAAAISYLSRLSAESPFPEVGETLKEESGPARLAALTALLYLRAHDEELDLTSYEEALASILHEPDLPVEEAVAALGLLKPGPPLLTRYLKDHPAAELRRQAIELADETVLREEIESLIAATREDDPALRKSAWTAIARIDPERALTGIVALCEANAETDIEEYFPALNRMAGRGVEDAQSRLMLSRIVEPVLAHSRNPALRARLVTMLRPPEATDLLVRLLLDEQEALAVRVAAAETLADGPDGPATRAALREALASPYDALSSRVALVLNFRRSAGTLPEGLAESLRGAPHNSYARAVVALLEPVDTIEARDLLLLGDIAATALLLNDLSPEVLLGMPEAVLEATRSKDAGIVCLALSRLPVNHPDHAEVATRLLSSSDSFVRLAAEGLLMRAGLELAEVRLADTLRSAADTRHGREVHEFHEEMSAAGTLADGLRAAGHEEFGARLQSLAVRRDRERLTSLAARSGRRAELGFTRELVNWRKINTRRAARLAALARLSGEATNLQRIAAIGRLEWSGRRADFDLLLNAALDPDPDVSYAARSVLHSMLSRASGTIELDELSDIEGWWRRRAYAIEVPVFGNGTVEFR